MKLPDDHDGMFPAVQDFFDQAIEEEREEEAQFFKMLRGKLTIKECGEIEAYSGMTEEEEKARLTKIKQYAEIHYLHLPPAIDRELRTWEGDNTYKKLKQTAGEKYEMDMFARLCDQVPLSLQGLEKIEEPSRTLWRKKIGNREITIWRGKPKGQSAASGDLAKRVFLGTYRFAKHRKTIDPGPIEFRELLEMLNLLECSQEQRDRIKDYLEAFAQSGIQIREVNAKGKEIFFDYAPLYKRFTWIGGTEYAARIFPVFNEECIKMIKSSARSQYLWQDDARLRRLPGLTDRDRLAQDKFKMAQGFPAVRIGMGKWLLSFGQLDGPALYKMSLPQIRAFVNKNFLQAKSDGMVDRYKIVAFREKKKYLKQIITFIPMPPVPHKTRLLEDHRAILEKIAARIEYRGGGAKIEGETIFEYLQNMAAAGRYDQIIEAYDYAEDEFDETTPVDEDAGFQNFPMMFWNELKRLKK